MTTILDEFDREVIITEKALIKQIEAERHFREEAEQESQRLGELLIEANETIANQQSIIENMQSIVDSMTCVIEGLRFVESVPCPPPH